MEVYLDNSATTKCTKAVVERMNHIMLEEYGNPSSLHNMGMHAEKQIKEAKMVIASSMKVKEKEIIFTSGGTESDNLAIIGAARAAARRGKHLITTQIEHPAVLESMKYLNEEGFEISYLPVNAEGVLSIEDLKNTIRKDTILVSIMHTNNEIGSIQPIHEIGTWLKQNRPDIIFHVDAVQGYGKARIYPSRSGIDLLSVSAHKIHGPKGVGFLYCNEKTRILPLLFGGGQQNAIRPGTENVAGIAGLAQAVQEIYQNLDQDILRMEQLRQLLISEACKLDGVTVNGSKTGAPHIVSLSVADVRSEVLLHALESEGIYISSGSACASNHPSVSDTLKAIGLKKELLDKTVRFSLSNTTTEEEIRYTINKLCDMIPMLRKFTRH
ncbi:MAG: cysteine desulfurase family protein [Lachnospiraceae bacterium]|nr:cysteine desulfurase family protein [Lachnospiraceae bacterium]MDD3660971.1 cysteine desulfurase family protein [Lachnospiraceae bacterium]